MRFLRLFLPLPVLLIVHGGCTVDAGPDAPIAEHAQTEKLAHMEFFADRAAATEWMTRVIRAKGMAHEVVPAGDPRFDRPARMIAEIWPVAISLYPEFEGLPPPEITAVASPGATFQVLVDPASKKTGHLILATTASLDRIASDLEAMAPGVFAHEIAHITLHHGKEEVQREVQKYFRVTEGHEEFGSNRADDPDARRQATEWMTMRRAVGPYFDAAELGDVPYGGSYQALMSFLLDSKAGDAEPCQKARSDRADWERFLEPGASYYDQRLSRLDPLQQVRVRTRSDGLETKLRACFEGRGAKLVELAAEMYKVPLEEAQRRLAPDDVAVFDREGASNMASGLFAMVHAVREKMRAMYIDVDVPRLRQFTFEDQADEHGFRLLAEVLRRRPELRYDPLGMGNWSLETYLTQTERQVCRDEIQAGDVPPYGDLQKNAPAMCYRLFRLQLPKE